MTLRDRIFDSAGVPIRYVDCGAGTPIVLAHSYTGNLDDQFVRTGVVDALAPRHRVIAFDLRGHGRSGKPHEPAAYGREMALDIVRLLDHAGVERAHIGGYSLGAHIVAQLLTLHPERFLGAILGGSCGRRRWTNEDDRRVEVEAAETETGVMRSQIARLWPPGARPPTDDELRARSAKYLAGNDRRALAAVRRSNRDQVVSDADLAAVGVPTLGIVGTEDPYIASFREVARVMPNVRVVVIEGATHNGVPARREFARAVDDFARMHAPAP
jgi:pimeloyl-ACP methyl ester carboxylesterase